MDQGGYLISVRSKQKTYDVGQKAVLANN